MRRLVPSMVLSISVTIFSGAACRVDDGGSASTEDEGGSDEPEPPKFEGADEKLEVSAAQTGEITLAVSNLRSDTRLDIDGRLFSLGGRSPASLDGETLHIALGGAMVTGTHELSLVHSANPDELRSEVLSLTIVPSDPTDLSPNILDDVAGEGDRLIAHGQGANAALALLDVQTELARVWAGQWLAEGFELELPGIAEATSTDLTISELGELRWVVVSWATASGVWARIAPIDGLGEPVGEASPVLELATLDEIEDLLGNPELARIDAVALLDRMVVIGVEARRDAEQQTIGDHSFVTRWLSGDGLAAAPVLLRGPASADLDLPGDARLWTTQAQDAALAVRVGLGFPWLLTLASNGLPQLDAPPPESLALPSETTWMRSADGAFGSRHVHAIAADDDTPRVRVLRLDRWSATEREPSEQLDLVELPDWPVGEPALGLFDGVPSLLLPMGSETDVLALRSTGDGARLDVVTGLRCDELALASPGLDGIGDTLPLACLRDRQLQRGFVSAE